MWNQGLRCAIFYIYNVPGHLTLRLAVKEILSVILTRGKIVSILRESNRGYRARVAWEVGNIGALLQIPDLDLGISCPSAKNETIRVELSTGESCREHTETLLPPTEWQWIKLSNTQVNRGSYRSQHFHQWLWWGLYQSGYQKMPSTAEQRRNKSRHFSAMTQLTIDHIPSSVKSCLRSVSVFVMLHTHLILRGTKKIVPSSM